VRIVHGETDAKRELAGHIEACYRLAKRDVEIVIPGGAIAAVVGSNQLMPA